jgi:transposase
MYIRQTTTSNSATGEAYFTYRLVASERVGKQVRQRTKLNLGRHFTLPKAQWPVLCRRIEALSSGQIELCLEPVSATIEALAQRYYAQLVVRTPLVGPVAPKASVDTTIITDSCALHAPPEYQEVDVASLELVRPRSVGVEHAGLQALTRLGLPEILTGAGLNGIQRSCALGSIIGRLAAPGSELATWRWLRDRSALGELLEVDFEGVALSQLYRVSDLLLRHQEQIEQQLFGRLTDLFSLSTTVTLYDLTNTFFEGELARNAKALPGHSKEKRSDCPLITLGLVLDGSGFVQRSRTFAGNVGEAGTLEGMLAGLNAPKNATVIMDRGIATADNVAWLVAHHYRYLVVSREQERRFEEDLPVTETTTAGDEVIRMQRVLSSDGTEVRLYCYSENRAEKERAMGQRFTERFEQGLATLAAGLTKPRGERRLEKLWEKIGRLKERSHGIGQHYTITLTPDESGIKAVALTWEKTPVPGTLLTHPGVYCLRTNELTWDETTLWQTYTMLTDLEAVFRCLKSELGLRPVYHHKEARADGHLFITVLAYQAIQAIRRQLKEQGLTTSWTGLREILSVQQRVTATFRQRDGRTLHVRKATVAEPKLQKIYDVLGISAQPGGLKKMIH